MKEMEEVLKLFKEAFDHLTMSKDRITARAAYNRAQTLLDSIEKDTQSKAGALVRKFRPKIRQQLLHEKSLLTRFAATLDFWKKVVQQGAN